MTTALLIAPPETTRKLAGAEAATLLQRSPPRRNPESWHMTEADTDYILDSLGRRPLRAEGRSAQYTRMVGARAILAWLTSFPGSTWQASRDASPAALSPAGWHSTVLDWAAPTVGRRPTSSCLASGALALICADVVRPSPAWLAASSSNALRPAMAAARDPEGFARQEAAFPADIRDTRHASAALKAVARVLATFGRRVEDIVVGDLLALLQETNHAARGTRIAVSSRRTPRQRCCVSRPARAR
ncbi:hypothetical protein [Streptomyces durhamensis]|uniref:hypothetical protein n=1 Tax=Streptomyces durhamensis TaxID=68194 RepID=UPI0006892658|nr:hypothetical protein [Streptomyces durhamensis]